MGGGYIVSEVPDKWKYLAQMCVAHSHDFELKCLSKLHPPPSSTTTCSWVSVSMSDLRLSLIQPPQPQPQPIVFTGRNEVVTKVIFLHLSVILFTGGVSASVHAVIPLTPRSRHPPRADVPQSRHPLEQTPPRADTPPKQTLE